LSHRPASLCSLAESILWNRFRKFKHTVSNNLCSSSNYENTTKPKAAVNFFFTKSVSFKRNCVRSIRAILQRFSLLKLGIGLQHADMEKRPQKASIGVNCKNVKTTKRVHAESCISSYSFALCLFSRNGGWIAINQIGKEKMLLVPAKGVDQERGYSLDRSIVCPR
jgi:hypothetical protein